MLTTIIKRNEIIILWKSVLLASQNSTQTEAGQLMLNGKSQDSFADFVDYEVIEPESSTTKSSTENIFNPDQRTNG